MKSMESIKETVHDIAVLKTKLLQILHIEDFPEDWRDKIFKEVVLPLTKKTVRLETLIMLEEEQ